MIQKTAKKAGALRLRLTAKQVRHQLFEMS
jgi:hypothetical protein